MINQSSDFKKDEIKWQLNFMSILVYLILVISRQIMRMISDQIEFHLLQLPL